MFKEYSSFCCSCRKNNKNSITLDCKHPICIQCIANLLINNQASQMLLDEIQVECKDCNYATFLSIPLAYKLTRSLNLRNVPGQSQNMKIALFCMQCLERPFTIEQYLSGQHKNHKLKTVQQATPFLINILSYAAKDLQQSVDNLYREEEKLQHCIHLMNDVVTANVAKIKLGFEQLRSQINKREQEIELAYRIEVEKQFQTVQIDLDQLHRTIAQGKRQLEWIVQNGNQNEFKQWNYEQNISLANYFADNFPSFSILREFEQTIRAKVPSYMQMVRLNTYIVSINGIKPIVDSIRYLKCFEEQDIDQTSTQASSTLSSSYFQEKKKQIFGDKDIHSLFVYKLEMMNGSQETGKTTKNNYKILRKPL